MTEASTFLGMNKSNVVTVAGLAGAAFIGYCVYFDHKRRSAPDYKNKIRQKRREKSRGGKMGPGVSAPSSMPDVSDPSSMQAFFLQEVQIGEELMSQGNVQEGAIHIANAIALCGQGQQLLQIFQQTLPPDQFNAVIEQLPHTRERLSAMFGNSHEEGAHVEEITDAAQAQLIDDTDDLE